MAFTASCWTTRSIKESPGQASPRPKVLKRVSYRSDGAVTQNVVVHWRRNLPKKRDECWFLMSDQPGSAHQLCNLYGRRMTIEQLFRDDKSKRNGWSLRDTQITKPDRLDRLLLILAIAYLLLCGIGLMAKTQFKPSAWCSTNRDIECSIYTIGMIMMTKMKTTRGVRRRFATLGIGRAKLGMIRIWIIQRAFPCTGIRRRI